MMGVSTLALLAALAPLLPLAIGIYNRLTWPRPRAIPGNTAPAGSVSILIPARNEAKNIRACLEAALAQGPVVREVLVYSDESTDETEAIVTAMAEVDSRIRLLIGGKLPPGWVGKPYGCQQLGEQASAPWLLFLDADVRLAPGGIVGLLSASVAPQGNASQPRVVSALPAQLGGTWWLDVLQPLLLLTYASWLPLAWANRQKSWRFLAACGQVLLVSRSAFAAVEGFGTVRHAVVDDVEFCRRARRMGVSVDFLDGHELASCRMYETVPSFWRGFGKNVFPGLGSELNLALALVLHVACFLLPYACVGFWGIRALAGAPAPAVALACGVFGVLANVLHRAVLALRHGQSGWSVVVHPFAVLFLLVLSLDSWRRTRFLGVEWAGRTYLGRIA